MYSFFSARTSPVRLHAPGCKHQHLVELASPTEQQVELYCQTPAGKAATFLPDVPSSIGEECCYLLCPLDATAVYITGRADRSRVQLRRINISLVATTLVAFLSRLQGIMPAYFQDCTQNVKSVGPPLKEYAIRRREQKFTSSAADALFNKLKRPWVAAASPWCCSPTSQAPCPWKVDLQV